MNHFEIRERGMEVALQVARRLRALKEGQLKLDSALLAATVHASELADLVQP